jgi:hypothetical protein
MRLRASARSAASAGAGAAMEDAIGTIAVRERNWRRLSDAGDELIF